MLVGTCPHCPCTPCTHYTLPTHTHTHTPHHTHAHSCLGTYPRQENFEGDRWPHLWHSLTVLKAWLGGGGGGGGGVQPCLPLLSALCLVLTFFSMPYLPRCAPALADKISAFAANVSAAVLLNSGRLLPTLTLACRCSQAEKPLADLCLPHHLFGLHGLWFQADHHELPGREFRQSSLLANLEGARAAHSAGARTPEQADAGQTRNSPR